ncbi:hypothetical protein TNCV_3094011 [Trichonephila clavipes]|nr:hypothetical protein TNCV_3094011 [Trichonephila clavipes]
MTSQWSRDLAGGKVPQTGQYRCLGSRACQLLTSLYPDARKVTGTFPTSIFGLKIHHTRGGKDQWLNSNPGNFQAEM